MFSSDKWFGASAGFYPETINQSLRFEDGDDAKLTRTPSSASNRKTWTLSTWIKRGNLGTNDVIFGAYDSPHADFLRFNSSNELEIALDNTYQIGTNAKFRDTTNWYHIVLAFDVTQSTSTDRIKIYVNGTQQTLKIIYNSYPANQDFAFNSTNIHTIGELSNFSNYNFDGYMAEFNFIDGTALTPTSFGETKNGVWIPKAISGLTYGTNGFRLTFADSSSLGDDTSGNGNDYTSSGLASTDVVPDSPTNNFCTLSSIQNQTSATLSEGSLKAVGTSANWDNLQSTFAVSSGKWYWEVKATSVSEANSFVAGIHETSFPAQSLFWFSGSYTTSAYGTAFGVLDPDNKVTNGSATAFTLGLATNDIIQFRLNLDDNELSVSIDGSDKGKIYDITANVEYTPALSLYNTSSATMNFGQDSTFAGTETAGGNADANGKGDFKYSVPSGYLALCSSNLPDTTISPNQSEQADDYFNTVLYSGNGSTQSITGVGFAPDWVWIKERTSTSTHALADTSRGATKILQSDQTDAEVTATTNFTSFDSDGFSHGNSGRVNESGQTYVAWNWKANGGTTSSNTDGTITSTVQANTTAGFSIVKYTGSSGAQNVGHGLTKAPELLFVKDRDASSNWWTGTTVIDGSMDFLYLNLTNASGNSSITAPTSTTFQVDGTDLNTTGNNKVAYCFHSVEGYSKIGTYTGNSNADGTFVYTGFRPSFLLGKKTSGVDNWFIHDNARDPDNVVQNYLMVLTNSEASDSSVDFLSNGFKWRLNSGMRNSSGQTYLYMAFAEQPFKFSNAR